MKDVIAATAGQWTYIDCSCLVTLGTGVSVSITYECEACGNTNLRFLHALEHNEDKREIQVGIECASVLMRNDVPRLAENETKRKESWRQKYRKPGRCRTTIEDLEGRGKL